MSCPKVTSFISFPQQRQSDPVGDVCESDESIEVVRCGTRWGGLAIRGRSLDVDVHGA
jgi:hypothetical protein